MKLVARNGLGSSAEGAVLLSKGAGPSNVVGARHYVRRRRFAVPGCSFFGQTENRDGLSLALPALFVQNGVPKLLMARATGLVGLKFCLATYDRNTGLLNLAPQCSSGVAGR